MIERRKFLRIKEEGSVSYSVMPRYKSEQTVARDSSLGGIRFISDNFISPGSILKLKIELQYAQKIINALARLVWITAVFDNELYEVGVEFIEINSGDLEFLRDYLSKPR